MHEIYACVWNTNSFCCIANLAGGDRHSVGVVYVIRRAFRSSYYHIFIFSRDADIVIYCRIYSG